MSKSIREYITEKLSEENKEKIIRLLDNNDLTDNDALYIINHLDKDGETRVRDYISKYRIPEKFIKRIISSDKLGEIKDIADGKKELPSFSIFRTGSNILDLFSGVLSENLVREIYDIEGSSGTGNIGKGEILLNLFIKSDRPGGKGRSGDVHIWDTEIRSTPISIEIKTTPNAHPGDRNVRSFYTVIESLEKEFGIDENDADLFFRVKNGSQKVTKIIQDYMDRNDCTNIDVFGKIFDCITSQFSSDTSDKKDFSQLVPEKFIDRSGRPNIQELVNLAGAVQLKHYIKEQSENVDFMCIIDGHTMNYKLIDCSVLNSISEILNIGIKFSNAMDKKYAAGSQTSTMKFNRIK